VKLKLGRGSAMTKPPLGIALGLKGIEMAPPLSRLGLLMLFPFKDFLQSAKITFGSPSGVIPAINQDCFAFHIIDILPAPLSPFQMSSGHAFSQSMRLKVSKGHTTRSYSLL